MFCFRLKDSSLWIDYLKQGVELNFRICSAGEENVSVERREAYRIDRPVLGVEAKRYR